MQIGQQVKSKAYPEKRTGRIVEIKQFAGMSQALVFFEKDKKNLLLPGSDLISLENPQDKIRQGRYSKANRFYLRLLLERIKARKTQEGFKSAGGFKILPLPHQLLAVDFVLSRLRPRALIADEVGLGKTIEAALIYEELKARGVVNRVIVIAPAGICRQWQSEMKQKFNEDFAIFDKETVIALKQLHGTNTNIWTLKNRIITSMDFVKPRKITKDLSSRTLASRRWHNDQVFEAVVEAGFDLVIFDEAHKLSKDATGEETFRYKMGNAMAEAAPFFLLLTATPHQGDPAKFKNLLNLVDSHLFLRNSDLYPENVGKVTVRNNKRAVIDFENRKIFKKRFTSLFEIERDPDKDEIEIKLYNAVTQYVSQSYEMARRLNDRTTMFLLLIYQRMVSSSSRAILKSLLKRLDRLKSDHKNITDSKQEESADNDQELDWEELEEVAAEDQITYLESRSAYGCKKIEQSFLDLEIAELQKCVDLARKAVIGRNDTKFMKLLEIIDELKIRENDPGLKFIVFTEFVETQKYLCDCLSNLGYEIALINGSMSSEEKERQKQLFEKKAQFLISTDAGGEGINLQFCRAMINYDLPWNPMRLEQRIGRIDRIGQKHDVKVINFQLKDTVEKRVRDVIEEKLERIRKEFNDGEDKLADILSNLQEEFDFEKIYMDAVRDRGQDDRRLDEIAKNIYQRAKEIIRQGELVLPFSELKKDYVGPKRELEIMQESAKVMLANFLELHGQILKPYQGKNDIYYFDDPLTGKRYSQVFFNQELALEHDDCQLMGFTHPYMGIIINHLEEELAENDTAKLKIEEARFTGISGFLFLYKVIITNNIDPQRVSIISCFVDQTGEVNQRISRYFEETEIFRIEEFIKGEINCSFDHAFKKAQSWVEERAETYFLEFQKAMLEKIYDREEKIANFFTDKQKSVQAIAIENIRDSKLKELKDEKRLMKEDLNRRKQMVPSLECIQIAYVEFNSAN